MRKQVVGCLIRCGNRYLVLQRAAGKTQAGKFGIPAGKIDFGETKEEALEREVFEETGFRLDTSAISLAEKIDHEFDETDQVTFFAYVTEVSEEFEPKLSPSEHTGWAWMSLSDMRGSDQTIDTLADIVARYEAQSS